MNHTLFQDAQQIIGRSIEAVLPDEAVRRALEGRNFSGRIILVAVGKAAWQMAKAASDCLGERIHSGIVVTKYDHVRGAIPGITCYEGGHPVPDDNSVRGTEAVLELTGELSAEDTVLFLLSGGGSALFEKPLIPLTELQNITEQLLAGGADITEMNTIRKRLSAVKGGRFALHCAPARVYSVILSDILGDPMDMIASGPACPDPSTCEEAISIAEKHSLRLSDEARHLLTRETPKTLTDAEAVITGSVKELCRAAAEICEGLGYEVHLLTDCLCCEARDAGAFLASVARSHAGDKKALAFLAGGETVVHLTGKGKGGRNQELALAAAEGISGLENVAVFSVGSDGTDGPTDAAGGYADGDTAPCLSRQGIRIHDVLQENDAYHALQKTEGLIITGPTGTNVNDLSVVLIRP